MPLALQGHERAMRHNEHASAEPEAWHPNGGYLPGVVAAGIYLTAPWTLITGSMAYNEQAMMAFGAVAFLVVLHPLRCPGFSGLIIGIACALATLSKISAPLGIAIPVGVLMLLDTRGGRAASAPNCDEGASVLRAGAGGAVTLAVAAGGLTARPRHQRGIIASTPIAQPAMKAASTT